MLTNELFSKDELEAFAQSTSLFTLNEIVNILQQNTNNTQAVAEKMMNKFFKQLNFSSDFNIAEECAMAYAFIGNSFSLYTAEDNKKLRKAIKETLLFCLDVSILELDLRHETSNTPDNVKDCKYIDMLIRRYQIEREEIKRYQKYRSLKTDIYTKEIKDFFLRVCADGIRPERFDDRMVELTAMAEDINIDINGLKVKFHESKYKSFNCDLAYLKEHCIY